MAIGPVEYVLVQFSGKQFRAELVAVLINLVESKTIRIMDLVVIRRTKDGSVTWLEIDDLDDDVRELFFDLEGEYGGLLNDEDIGLAAQSVSPGATAVAIVWEDTWATSFAATVKAVGGEIIANERIPRPDIEPALDALALTST